MYTDLGTMEGINNSNCSRQWHQGLLIDASIIDFCTFYSVFSCRNWKLQNKNFQTKNTLIPNDFAGLVLSGKARSVTFGGSPVRSAALDSSTTLQSKISSVKVMFSFK